MFTYSLAVLGLSLGFLFAAIQTDLSREVISKILLIGAGVIGFYIVGTQLLFDSQASPYIITSLLTAVCGAYLLLVFKYIARNG